MRNIFFFVLFILASTFIRFSVSQILFFFNKNNEIAACMNLLNFNFHLNGLIVVNELERKDAILSCGACLFDVAVIIVVFVVDMWLTQHDERSLICTDICTVHAIDDKKKFH